MRTSKKAAQAKARRLVKKAAKTKVRKAEKKAGKKQPVTYPPSGCSDYMSWKVDDSHFVPKAASVEATADARWQSAIVISDTIH